MEGLAGPHFMDEPFPVQTWPTRRSVQTGRDELRGDGFAKQSPR